MKQFNSSKTSGSEAIVMASVRWWVQARPSDLAGRVDRTIAELPSDAFTMDGDDVMRKTIEALGGRYLELDPSFPDDCWEDIMAQDGLGHALQTAIDEWPGPAKREYANREEAAFLLSRVLAQYVGAYLRGSPLFGRFDANILATRENVKIVRGVMES